MKKLRTMEESYKNKETRNFYQGARKAREAPQKITTYRKRSTKNLS
jgi:hypothetical protein